jgi:hypothetical protein
MAEPTTNVRHVARTFRPEQYKRIGRTILEAGLTGLYVLTSIFVALEAPTYMVPFAEAAIQLFILTTFFQYGVGYMNPFTTVAVYIVGLNGGERGRPQPDGSPDPVHAHRMSFVDTAYFVVGQLLGAGVAMMIAWVLYDGESGHYGFEPLMDGSLGMFRHIIQFAIVGTLTMLPKLLAARKRHTVGTNVPIIVATAYVIAGYIKWRSILPWLAPAILSNLGGFGWSSGAQWDIATVIIGQLAALALSVVVVITLPRRKKSVRRLDI